MWDDLGSKGAAPEARSLLMGWVLRLVVGRSLIELPRCFLVSLVRSVVYRSGLEWRCAGREAQAFEDLAGDRGIFDGGGADATACGLSPWPQ